MASKNDAAAMFCNARACAALYRISACVTRAACCLAAHFSAAANNLASCDTAAVSYATPRTHFAVRRGVGARVLCIFRDAAGGLFAALLKHAAYGASAVCAYATWRSDESFSLVNQALS